MRIASMTRRPVLLALLILSILTVQAILSTTSKESTAIQVRSNDYVSNDNQSPSSVNVVVNPGFEQGLGPTGFPLGWLNWTKHGGATCSTTPDCISLDNTTYATGTASARLDLGQLDIGFIAIAQTLPGTLRFRNLTDRADSIDMWFYYQPKYAGSGDIRIRILYGENVGEIDYVFDPDPFLAYPNSTFMTPYGPGGVKNVFLYGYAPAQWYHFQRNLRADWVAPLKLLNGSFVPGFSLDIPLPRIQFDAIGFRSGSNYYSETVWIDDFKLYADTTTPPPSGFDFSLSNSGPITVTRGASGSNTITVNLVSGMPELVSLSCSAGLPLESSCLFNPQSDLPTFTSILTISTSSSTPTGSFTITVSGISGGITHTTQFILRTSVLINRSGWSLAWETSPNDGIAISNVSFDGASILSDARLPGILSTYTDNYCGPFYEELRSDWIPEAQVSIEDLPTGGFQIRGAYNVPGEDFQQIWRFHTNGTFLGLLRIGPAGCLPEHLYESRWRYDFNLANNDMLLVFDGTEWSEVTGEGEFFDEGVKDHLHNAPWAIKGNERAFFFSPFDSEPQNGTGTLLAVLERSGEVELAHSPAETPYRFLKSESLSGRDTSFWYLSKHSGNPLDRSISIITGLSFRPGASPQPPSGGLPVVSVWSQACGASVITMSNPACGALTPGSQINVEINITDAPSFNGYDVSLYYDPNYLLALSTDTTTGTVFGSEAFVVREEFSILGRVRLAVVKLGPAFPSGSGTLAHVNFRLLGTGVSPLVLAAGMTKPSDFAQSYTILAFGASYIGVTTSDGYFSNDPSRSGPTAAFTSSPSPGKEGVSVTFDSSSSFDDDNDVGPSRGIAEYQWDFGDGFLSDTSSPVTTHIFQSVTGGPFTGNFSVRLTVVDSDGLIGMKTSRVEVIRRPIHDLAASISAIPLSVSAGENVSITVLASNLGTFDETFDLTVEYSRPLNNSLRVVLDHLTGETMRPLETQSYSFLLSTGGLELGAYLIQATVSPPADDRPTNNQATAQIEVVGPNVRPVASFTFSPRSPVVGETVFFDGTASTDPDGFITEYLWSFGDGRTEFSGPFTLHNYFSPGDYTVTLTVTDNRGSSSSTSQVVSVRPRPAHDVSVDNIFVSPTEVVSSQFVGVTVLIKNKGLSPETVDLAVYFNSQVIETRTGIEIESGPYTEYVQLIWDTAGVQAGEYTISATVSLVMDEFPEDNTFTNGIVTVQPPPVLTASPGSGVLGAKVTVQGSGFPPPPFGPGFSQVFVTFDDMFLGFTIARSGEFDFTFNAPHAEPGPHLLKAFDTFSGAKATVAFEVLTGPAAAASLSVMVDVGAVYFPGENADIFVLTSRDGSPTGPGEVELEIIVVRPDGSNVSLTARHMGPGLYKATYSVSRTGSLGTYAVLAMAHLGEVDGSSLGTFQVKPTWISSQGPRIASLAVAVGSILAILGLAWRNGYFERAWTRSFPRSKAD